MRPLTLSLALKADALPDAHRAVLTTCLNEILANVERTTGTRATVQDIAADVFRRLCTEYDPDDGVWGYDPEPSNPPTQTAIGPFDLIQTPAQWCAELGWDILDPDGWRYDSTPFETPCNRAEFERRVTQCTAAGPGVWPA
jgi:hypothetical protein